MKEFLKTGIAGYGVVGQRRAQFIREIPGLKTVAVCDQKFEGSGRLDNGISCHHHYRDLLTEDIEVLFVCLPNYLAPEVTIAGLKKGLHVFCEKPPGRNVLDIANVIEAERAHPGLKLKYGFNHRYHDSVKEALGIIQSQALGDVINLRGIYGKSALINFKSDWRTSRATAGGGILLDQGIHMVDLMRLFAGEEFVEYKSFVSNAFWQHDVEDNAFALMRTAHGKVAMLQSTATQWRHRFQLDITLSGGTLILSGILSGSKSYGQETLTIIERGENDGGIPAELTKSYIEDNSWRDEIAEFEAAISTGADIISGSSDDALKTMKTVYEIYCADREWRDDWNLSV